MTAATPERDVDAALLRAFGPCDQATAAWIAASIVAHRLPPSQLTLVMGVADYGQRAGAR